MTEEKRESPPPAHHTIEPLPPQDGTGPRPEGEPSPAAAETAEGVEQLRTKLEEAQKSVETLKDQFLRKAAEFDNYKRRSEAEFASLIRNANEGLLTALLPVVDDLVRSLRAGSEQKDYEAFYRGVEMIYAKLMKVLDAQGLAPFDSVGKPFDVAFHDALLQIPRTGVPPHTVVEEVEKGYLLNDKVLRHAKVVVSAADTTAEEPSGENDE